MFSRIFFGQPRSNRLHLKPVLDHSRPKVVVYKARKDYYGINGVPRADDAREEQTNIWQSIGDEPMILVPEAAPWPPLPPK